MLKERARNSIAKNSPEIAIHPPLITVTFQLTGPSSFPLTIKIMKRLIPLLVAAVLLPTRICLAENASPFTPPNFPLPKFADSTFNVKEFGAIGDGVANDTPAINKAIEKCNASGGGTVSSRGQLLGSFHSHQKQRALAAGQGRGNLRRAEGKFRGARAKPEVRQVSGFWP